MESRHGGAGSDGLPGPEFADSLVQAAWVSCPYCGEEVELLVDRGGGATQEYVEDCEVCCRPWAVSVRQRTGGEVSVSVATLDE
jgi:hypothetical protein